MGKNKLTRWAEIKTFNNVIEPDFQSIRNSPHPLKGLWQKEYFKNNNPIILELGCGKGEYTTGLAEIMPAINFIGIDIKGARLWRGAKTAIEKNLKNVLFIRTRIEFITNLFAEDEIDEIWLPFPDPHEKKRNISKRLTSPLFLNKYRTFLKNGGLIHLKTDNKLLYEYTLNLVSYNNLEIICSTTDVYSSHSDDRILTLRTFYEDGFLKEGKKIHYLSFRLDKKREIIDYEQK
ncbi:MAG TPA: tRNA (guanosine(46)-N7)-methyltransferase TrmB [Bacteroidales bacterium]|nr:tRNA (guanosine(46)-N7)-methyltransferase TrmB [Bacteroidales bacterium]HOK74020.1 tRNA (guanosine(46)-N7)-methyltransferase TrmB [Bacteroidales bacterium]HOM40812.1 tRNA (guanosine(46)-N7)-methyltransferase TrmB [Bacteroidales bacterium]HPP92524.1 tRNA (guanosine(46)-N7)-methyltransferase TrmB [Bacteroidales bacterium]HQK69911.1 tRNA (guanosine(46)-N7)-methyltransferase TrmB [Bacteroidales bacterium]